MLGAALALSGCSSSQDCDVVACLNAVHVVVAALSDKLADDLPYTLEVCVGGTSCSSFRFEATGGGNPPECTSLAAGTSTCTIDGMGNVVLSGLEIAGESNGSVSVHATVTSSSKGVLFDSTQMDPVDTSELAPGCGTCKSVSAEFTP